MTFKIDKTFVIVDEKDVKCEECSAPMNFDLCHEFRVPSSS